MTDSIVDKLSIQRMQVADLTDVICIEEDVFGDPWMREHFLREIDKTSISSPLVARIGDSVVGYAVAWFVADEVHLANIAVQRAQWRRGVGQALLDEVVKQGRLRGCRLITLEVRISNFAALTFYEKNKFRKVAIRKKYYADTGEDAVVMLRGL